MAGGAIYGAGYAMTHTLLFMVIIDRSRADRRGAAVGALYFAYDAGQAAGAFVLGWAMEHIGHAWGLVAGYRWGWGIGALALAGCLLLVRPVADPRASPGATHDHHRPVRADPPGRGRGHDPPHPDAGIRHPHHPGRPARPAGHPGFYRRGNGNFWVALADGEVVGTLALLDLGEGQGALRKMFVQAPHRGPRGGRVRRPA